MPYVYILECADGSYYTGSTWDLEKRLWEHQNGLGAKHTAKRLPVKLVFCEACERVEDAYIREKQIQGWSRKKKEALMAGDWERVHGLAECQNASHSRNVGFDSAQPTLLDSVVSINPGHVPSPAAISSNQPAGSKAEGGRALSRSAPLTGTGAELGVEVGRALSGVDVGRALNNFEVRRALSGVEGNAGRATESSFGHAPLNPDMTNQETDSPSG